MLNRYVETETHLKCTQNMEQVWPFSFDQQTVPLLIEVSGNSAMTDYVHDAPIKHTTYIVPIVWIQCALYSTCHVCLNINLLKKVSVVGSHACMDGFGHSLVTPRSLLLHSLFGSKPGLDIRAVTYNSYKP